jgi:hypothetical protein
MQVNTLQIIGRGSQTLAPLSGVDLIRLADVQTLLTGYLPLGSTFPHGSVTDFSPAVLAVLAANGVPLSGTVNLTVTPNGGIVYDALGLRVDSGVVALVGHTHSASAITNFSPAVLAVLAANGVPLSGTVNLTVTPNGGIVYDALGIRVDSGVVSRVGHQHVTTDILNFASGVATQLAVALVSTATVQWHASGGQLSGIVPVVGGGGLLATGGGLMIDSGVVSLVGHTHAQLHNALTLGTSTSLALVLAGQQLSGEIALAPTPGLLNTPSGVACDFGTGHNQVMRGDALTGLSLTGVTSTLNSLTLQLGIAGTVLSGVVPLDSNPPAGYGVITVGLNGLRVRLGTDSQSAAAGNHVHTAATNVADGFMSSTMFNQLATLWAETPLSGVTVFSTPTLQLSQNGQQLSGVVPLDPNPAAGYGKIQAGPAGLRTVNQPISGVLTIVGATTTAPVNPSGVAAWFAVSVNGTAYKLPLYQ